MATIEKSRDQAVEAQGVSYSTLVDHLGADAAKELFNRIDGSQRKGEVILGANVRDARAGFSRAKSGNAQFVVVGRSTGRRTSNKAFADSMVLINMDDFEAVVKAAQKRFDWTQEFAPRAGLAAATETPVLKRGSRGRRQLQA